jgi:hypothetical protein
MLKQTLLAFSLLLSVFLPAQDKVSELHYKTVLERTNKEASGAAIGYGKWFMKIQTRPVHSRNPLRFIDKKNDVMVMTFNSASHGYIIESLDTVYRINSRLEPTGETEKINGYNCEKFQLIETPNNNNCKSSYFIGYYIWTTHDLEVDSSYNLYVSHAVFPFSVFTYSGVIVKAKSVASYGPKYDCYTILDSIAKKPELEADFERPWIKYPDAVCVLPEADNIDSYARSALPTCQDMVTYRERIRALSRKITGIEKPKYNHGYQMIAF